MTRELSKLEKATLAVSTVAIPAILYNPIYNNCLNDLYQKGIDPNGIVGMLHSSASPAASAITLGALVYGVIKKAITTGEGEQWSLKLRDKK